MIKTLFMVVVVLVIGYAIILGLFALLKQARRMEDDEHNEKIEVTRDLRNAKDDFLYEQHHARRMNDLKNPEKKKKK